MSVVKSSGTVGTDYPSDMYGHCCARDPSRPLGNTFAYCFGGQNYQDDSNAVWKIDYSGIASPWTKLITSGFGGMQMNIPSRRRAAACAFVGPNEFAVFGGFSVDEAKPMTDSDTYILNIVTNEWKRHQNHNTVKGASNAKMATCYFNSNSTFRTFMFGGSIQQNGVYADTLFFWNETSMRFEPQMIKDSTYQPTSPPTARTFQNSFSKLGKMYVANGVDEKKTEYNDLWMYTIGTNQWQQLTFSTKWTARYAASSAMIGSLVYMYGGYGAWNSGPIAELILVDVDELSVQIGPDVVFGSSAAPFGRYHHVSFAQGNLIVIQGGKNALDNVVGTFHVFDTVAMNWYRVYPEGNQSKDVDNTFLAVFARYGHAAISLNDTHSIIGLGFGSANVGTHHSFYWISNVDAASNSFSMNQFNMTAADAQRRDYARAFAGVAPIGISMIMVCGGVISLSSSSDFSAIMPPQRAVCYSVNIRTYTWNPVPSASTTLADAGWILASPSLVPIANKVYMAFGQRSNGIATVESTSNQILTFTFNQANMCSLGDTGLSCIYCSKGFIQPLCTPAPKGTYSADPSIAAQNCPAGTYNPWTGASDSSLCIPCPLSTDNPSTGQEVCLPCPSGSLCLVGSSAALAESSPRAQTFLMGSYGTSQESHPSAYTSPSIPYFWVLLISSVLLLVLLILTFIVTMSWKSKRNRLQHFLNDDANRLLKDLFKEHAKGRWGMTTENFMTCLVTEQDRLPAHSIDIDAAHKIFNFVDKYHSQNLLFHQFQSAMCVAVEYGYMNPFPGTDSVKNRKMDASISEKLGRISLEDLDLFEDQHENAVPGEPNRFQRTWYGGAITLASIVIIVGLVMMVILDFLLSSIAETKSLVPWAVIHSAFAAQPDGGLTIATHISAAVTWWGLLRSGQGAATLRDTCIASTAPNNSPTNCASAMVIPNSNWYSLSPFDPKTGTQATTKTLSSTTKCSWDPVEETCTVTWDCKLCGVTSGGNLTFLVSSALASPMMKTTLSTGTGIHQATTDFIGTVNVAGGPMEYSTVTSYVRPADNKTVFSGFPASSWSFDLSPTYFQAEQHAVLVGNSDAVYKEKGYHVRQPVAATPGNAVPPAMFARYFDAPVTLLFTVDNVPVHCSRAFIRTLIDMFTSLLGSVTGATAAIVIVLNLFDKQGGNKNFEEEEQLKDRQELEAKNKMLEYEMHQQQQQQRSPAGKQMMGGGAGGGRLSPNVGGGFQVPRTPITTEVFEKLHLLMSTGLTLKQAEAVIKIAQGGEVISTPAALAAAASSGRYRPSSSSRKEQPETISSDATINVSPSMNSASKRNFATNNLRTMPPPTHAQLNAPDYVLDEAVNSTGMFYSQQAGLFWHEQTNMFYDPRCEAWFDANERCWKPAS